MGKIFGDIGIQDTDRLYSQQSYVDIIWRAANEYMMSLESEMRQATSLFVEADIRIPSELYKLPGAGFMQRIGPDGRPMAVKRIGQWPAGYPLHHFSDMIESNEEALAYMTVGEFEAHVETVVNDNSNSVRREILCALFDWNTFTHLDPVYGEISVYPLANSANAGDTLGAARNYPPLVNSGTVDATDNHYLVSGYASSGINSTTQNPVATITRKLQQRFGTKTGGSNIVILHHFDERDNLQGLTEYVDVPDFAVQVGDDTDIVPVGSLPSKIFNSAVTWWVHGRFQTSGAFAVEWDRIPSGYLVGIHMGTRPPLKRRLHPADVIGQLGGVGLNLHTREQEWPHNRWIWSNRYGYGVGNPLSAVVMQLKTGTDADYDVPSGFARP